MRNNAGDGPRVREFDAVNNELIKSFPVDREEFRCSPCVCSTPFSSRARGTFEKLLGVGKFSRQVSDEIWRTLQPRCSCGKPCTSSARYRDEGFRHNPGRGQVEEHAVKKATNVGRFIQFSASESRLTPYLYLAIMIGKVAAIMWVTVIVSVLMGSKIVN